jgi:hypothetical protein
MDDADFTDRMSRPADAAAMAYGAKYSGFNWSSPSIAMRSAKLSLRQLFDAVIGRKEQNRLTEFFDNRKSGQGIWKWRHYFDVYDRHFSKFRGQEVNIVEIGVFSGGSLEM